MRIQRGRPDRGAAAVEFALILPLFFLILAGVVDFGRLFYANILVANAAREGVRMVALGVPEDADRRALAALPDTDPLLGPDNLALSMRTCPDDDGASYTVRATEFRFVFLDALFPVQTPPLQATATMLCEVRGGGE